MAGSHKLPDPIKRFPIQGQMRPVKGGAWMAATATILADVTLGEDANVWFGCVIRGDDAPITIGARTNIQDGTVIHADPGVPNQIGEDVTVGHRCTLHGAQVGDRCLIGMGAILLGGSVIGEESLIGAGCVVKENMVVPPRSLVVGIPGRIVRSVTEEEVQSFRESAQGYVDQVQLYK